MAGASGALLMASMFLPWFGLDTRIELGGDAGSASVEAARLNAFEAFGVIDVVLFASAALGIALAIRALLPSLPDNPLLATAVIVAAALSALLWTAGSGGARARCYPGRCRAARYFP